MIGATPQGLHGDKENVVRNLRHYLAPLIFLAASYLSLVVSGCSSDKQTASSDAEALRERFHLQALGATPYPSNNPPLPARTVLGRLLFYDPILSGEMDVACGTCHHPNFAFSDQRQFAAGTSGVGLGPERTLSNSIYSGKPIELVPRSTPTVLNAALNFDASEIGRAHV